jgi:hypothetical protein
MSMYTSTYQYQGVQGPTDPLLKHNAVEGYQPVSRIGEVVINAFGALHIAFHSQLRSALPDTSPCLLAVDPYEFTQLQSTLSIGEMKGTALYDAQGVAISQPPNAAYGNVGQDATAEHKPHFHEWATATPGMICVARRARNASFRNYVAAETASPVIVCAACQPKIMEDQYFFAGVCRSKSVRPIDDGVGPSTDEYLCVIFAIKPPARALTHCVWITFTVVCVAQHLGHRRHGDVAEQLERGHLGRRLACLDLFQ